MLAFMDKPQEEKNIDLRTASLDDLKSRDLSPAVIAQARKPKPTWFVERIGDRMQGKPAFIFACEEREAWDIINNHSTWKRRDFQFIGYSDGKTYQRVVAESMGKAGELEPEIAKAKGELEKYRGAEENLIIHEAVDMDGDPEDTANEENKAKVLRLRKIMEKLETKIEELEHRYNSHTADVVKRATAEEMKVAIKNWKKKQTWPRAVNIHTPGVSGDERSRILGAMGRRT